MQCLYGKKNSTAIKKICSTTNVIVFIFFFFIYLYLYYAFNIHHFSFIDVDSIILFLTWEQKVNLFINTHTLLLHSKKSIYSRHSKFRLRCKSNCIAEHLWTHSVQFLFITILIWISVVLNVFLFGSYSFIQKYLFLKKISFSVYSFHFPNLIVCRRDFN